MSETTQNILGCDCTELESLKATFAYGTIKQAAADDKINRLAVGYDAELKAGAIFRGGRLVTSRILDLKTEDNKVIVKYLDTDGMVVDKSFETISKSVAEGLIAEAAVNYTSGEYVIVTNDNSINLDYKALYEQLISDLDKAGIVNQKELNKQQDERISKIESGYVRSIERVEDDGNVVLRVTTQNVDELGRIANTLDFEIPNSETIENIVNEKFSELNEQVEAVQADIVNLTNSTNSAVNLVSEKIDAVKLNVNSEIDNLKKSVTNTETAFDDKLAELRTELHKEHDELHKEHDNLHLEYDALKDNFKDNINEVKNSVSAVSAEVQTTNNNLNRLQDIVIGVDSDLNDANAKQAGLIEKVRELEKTVFGVKEDCDNASVARESLQQQIIGNLSAIKSNQDAIKATGALINDLSNQVTEHIKNASILDGLKRDVDDISTKLTNVVAENVNAKVDELRKYVDTSVYEPLVNNVESLENTVAELDTNLNDFASALCKAFGVEVAEEDDSEVEVDDFFNENDVYFDDEEIETYALDAEVTEDIVEAISAHVAKVNELDSSVVALDSSINVIAEKVAALESLNGVGDCSCDFTQVNEFIETASYSLESIKAELAEKNKTIQELEEKVKNLQENSNSGCCTPDSEYCECCWLSVEDLVAEAEQGPKLPNIIVRAFRGKTEWKIEDGRCDCGPGTNIVIETVGSAEIPADAEIKVARGNQPIDKGRSYTDMVAEGDKYYIGNSGNLTAVLQAKGDGKYQASEPIVIWFEVDDNL